MLTTPLPYSNFAPEQGQHLDLDEVIGGGVYDDMAGHGS